MNNSFALVHPELVCEWGARNYPLTPNDVSYGSNKLRWWLGKCGHEWTASIKNRSVNDTGCPYCSHNSILEGFNDLPHKNLT